MIIKNILIGEDIRNETGNKLSLMGIFGSGVTIDMMPDHPEDAALALSLAGLVTLESSESVGNQEFSVLVEMKIGGEPIGHIKGTIRDADTARIFNLPVPRFEIRIQESVSFTMCAQVIQNNITVSEGEATLDITINKVSPHQE